MYSTKLSVSIHILTLISMMNEQPMTSDYIASSINTNPALVRRLMSRLKKAGFIETKTKLGVIRLAKPQEAITLLDIFKAVEDRLQLFNIHEEPNPNCPVGAQIEDTLIHIYGTIQTATEEKLASITLADVTHKFNV